jgi:type I restriction enzyme M protein
MDGRRGLAFHNSSRPQRAGFEGTLCMSESNLNWIANFIWSIADDVLRDVYVRGKYRDVILPMTVIRRLDAVLEPTKQAVLDMKARLDAAGITNQDAALASSAGQAFFNASPYTLRDLKARARQQQLRADFESYLNGFSPNVQEILDKFKFRNQIPTLVEADALGFMIEKFLDPMINLSPNPEYDRDGRLVRPGLDNHAMGTLFEELIRRFSEENNEEAGEHFTPRDVVELMAHLIFLPVADRIESGTYLVYDGACGTGGMLTIAEQTLETLAAERGKQVSIHLYGQEINPETYAIAKADLLLKGQGLEANNIAFGSTLSLDGHQTRDFDFMLSNPPYGKSWKTDQQRMGGKSMSDPRFSIAHAGDPEVSLITRSSDGQLMFLANMVSKMKADTPLGSRIAEVHNGSSLFTGDAGQGESNIRRWLIENDWLEAIIALPLNMFYNTGIATYIWVLTNRKPAHRRGKVQLIDATRWSQPLRKNLGQKNCELSPADITRIVDAFLGFQETGESKLFPNEAFGYWKVTVERPLRLRVDLGPEYRARLRAACSDNGDAALADLVDALASAHGPGPHPDYNAFSRWIEEQAGFRLLKRHEGLLRDALTEKDESAVPVVAKIHKQGAGADRLGGLYTVEGAGKPRVVAYEPDPDLRDTEQIPLLEKGAIEGFIEREVWPYAPDAWVDAAKTRIGYEISFNRYFYQPAPLRTLEEIRADIEALEQETDGLLARILVDVASDTGPEDLPGP